MAVTGEEIQIEIDALDDGGTKVEGAEPAADPAAEPKKPRPRVKPDDGIDVLKQQLEEERRQTETERQLRLVAEQNARDASESEARARTEAQTSQLDLVKNAAASLTTAQASLKDRYADALAAQDYSAAADIQLEMSTNAARIAQLEQAKTNLERAPKPQVRPAVDPVERITKDMDPRSAAWIKAHPEYARDPKKYTQMVAAHNLALERDGHVAGTDEYFASVEQILGIAKSAPADDPTAQGAKPTAHRRAAPPAAPVTRSGSGAGPRARTDTVTLTPEEVEMARLNDQTPEQYAREKLRIERDRAAGRLN